MGVCGHGFGEFVRNMETVQANHGGRGRRESGGAGGQNSDRRYGGERRLGTEANNEDRGRGGFWFAWLSVCLLDCTLDTKRPSSLKTRKGQKATRDNSFNV